MSQEALSNLLHEERTFPPSEEFASGAVATADLYDDAAKDRLGFWERQAERLEWAIDRLNETHRLLAAEAYQLSDEQLDALVPGLEYSVAVLLHGIIEHGTYHGGQIALLKKA